MVRTRLLLLCVWIMAGALRPLAVAQKPSPSESQNLLFRQGVQALGAHDYESARQAFETLAREGADSAPVSGNLGIAYLHTGHLNLAIQALARAKR